MDPKADQNLTCRDCRQDFIYSAGEQTFFESKGFNAPARCKSCRQARKSAQTYLTVSKDSES